MKTKQKPLIEKAVIKACKQFRKEGKVLNIRAASYGKSMSIPLAGIPTTEETILQAQKQMIKRGREVSASIAKIVGLTDEDSVLNYALDG